MICSWNGNRSGPGGKAGQGLCGSIWYQNATLENKSSRSMKPVDFPSGKTWLPLCWISTRNDFLKVTGSGICQR